MAVDGKGSPVTDLKKEEISIGENGQEREVADFHFDGGTEVSTPGRRLAPGLFTNRSEYISGPPKNIVAIVMDTLNTPVGDRAAVRAQTMRYLTALAPETRMAVYQSGDNLTVLHDSTGDLESLRARIAKSGIGRARTAASGAQFADVFGAGGTDASARAEAGAAMWAAESAGDDRALDRRLAQTLTALETLGSHLAAIPGRKSLIWIGAGTPILTFSGGGTPADPNGWLKVYDPMMRRTAQRLATQGIAVYPVDANGLPPPRLPGRAGPAGAMELMAEVTGGRVTGNGNDPTEGVKLAAADLRGVYTAAFYSADEPDGQWHNVAVRVRRRGVKLTYRQGYLSQEAAAEPQDWPERQWAAAIASPVGATALRLDAWCEMGPGADGATLNARLQVPDQDLYFRKADREWRAEVEFVVAEKTAAGESSMQLRRVLVRFPDDPTRDLASEAAQYSGRWRIDPNTSTIRLMARDRLTGRYGAIDVAVKSIPVAGEGPATEAAATPAGSGDPFIERARRASLAFLDTLPNYVVKQNTNREVQARANRSWTVQDRITAEVVYEAGKETTRDVMLNGKPVSAQKIEDTGAWSTGQFGGMLNALFTVESAAVFRERRGSAKVAGREARIYDFSVQRANSAWELSAAGKKYVSGYEGTVWIDRETARALRFQMRARDLPRDFPLDQAESSTEYGFVRIGSGEYLVPTGSVALVCSRTGPAEVSGRMRGAMGPARYCARNVIEFRGYKQFGAESNISFGPGK